MSRRATRLTRRHWRFAALAALAVVTACTGADDDAQPAARDESSIEFRDEVGPSVAAPERSMAMTVDAVDVADDDILIRVRVTNGADDYLDMGVQQTIYGPLLVMRDDLENRYESYAVEPAGIPGRRLAELSFRLAGPLDPAASTFTLELATQRGELTSPPGPLPERDAVRWRVDDDTSADPTFAPAPRLPNLIHFWLETTALPN